MFTWPILYKEYFQCSGLLSDFLILELSHTNKEDDSAQETHIHPLSYEFASCHSADQSSKVSSHLWPDVLHYDKHLDAENGSVHR